MSHSTSGRSAKEYSFDLYITVNSPGEIAGRAAPLVRELKTKLWNSRITLVVVPCQYASGSELEMASSIGADRVVRNGDVREMMRDDIRSGNVVRPGGKKLVMHLGGDLFFSVLLARRLRAKLWAYANRPRWGRFVERFFVPDERAERKFAILDFSKDRYEKIGQLILDSIVLSKSEDETRNFLGVNRDDQILVMLTGSRPIEYKRGVPFFSRIAGMITRDIPDLKVVFPLAPAVDDDLLRSALEAEKIAYRGESRVRSILIDEDADRWASVVRDHTLETLNVAKLAIAVPGTNNLQAAALFTPLIMVLPLDRADEYPLDGILGIIPLWVPGFRALKKKIILKKNAKTPYLSLPNIMADKMIAPEIRGLISEDDVARTAVDLLRNEQRLGEISRAFWELTHERGAAGKLADRIADFAKI